MKKIVFLLGLGFLVACSGGEKKVETVTPKAMEVIEEKKEVVELTVAAIGESMAEIAFEPKLLSVPANSRIVLTFENKSTAEGMLHNFVLIELGSGTEIATAGIKAGLNNNFVPEDDRVITYTKVSSMGETLTIEFDAPVKGSYHYVCTYPGHINMIGRLNVE